MLSRGSIRILIDSTTLVWTLRGKTIAIILRPLSWIGLLNIIYLLSLPRQRLCITVLGKIRKVIMIICWRLSSKVFHIKVIILLTHCTLISERILKQILVQISIIIVRVMVLYSLIHTLVLSFEASIRSQRILIWRAWTSRLAPLKCHSLALFNKHLGLFWDFLILLILWIRRLREIQTQ